MVQLKQSTRISTGIEDGGHCFLGARSDTGWVPDAESMLVEREDRWILPFRGLLVSQIRVDFALGLNLDEKAAVRIGGVARLGWVRAAVRPEVIELRPEH
jgi:hypothetical protein